MRALAFIVAASLLISVAPAAAKSIHAEFSEAWAERDDAYAKDFVAQLTAYGENGAMLSFL